MQPSTADPGATPDPAAVVREFLERLRDLGAGLDDAGRIELIGALEELKCQARVSVDFDASQRALQDSAGVPAEQQGRGVAAQIALARKESPHRGGRRLGAAKGGCARCPMRSPRLKAAGCPSGGPRSTGRSAAIRPSWRHGRSAVGRRRAPRRAPPPAIPGPAAS